MKLRSHEILSTPLTPIRSSANPSRLKQLFQRKNLFKKKQSTAHPTGLIHQIPDYVRKSIFRFFLEVKPASPPSPPPPPPSSSSRTARPPPVMGIQALKNKKQHFQRPPKRSLRIKYVKSTSRAPFSLRRTILFRQQSAHEHRQSFEDYQPPQPTNYDMTILHLNIDDIDDEDDEDELDSIFATKTSTNQNKPIPQWARSKCHFFHRQSAASFSLSLSLQKTNCK